MEEEQEGGGEEEEEQEGGGGGEQQQRFHWTLRTRSEGHRLRTAGITQFRRYVRKMWGGGAFNTANVP